MGLFYHSRHFHSITAYIPQLFRVNFCYNVPMNNNQYPFFSVIIPCLNEEHFLPHLLIDLQKQSFRDFEVIVVDGHSDDRTQAKVSEFTFVKLINSQKRNVSYQRNLGAKHARGKYLIFFDADNRLIDINYLKSFSVKIKVTPVTICSTLADVIDSSVLDKLMVVGGNTLVFISAFLKRPLFAGACLCTESTFFRKIGGFNEKLKLSEDHELVKRSISYGASYKLFRHPRYIFSPRRFHKDGYRHVLYQWLLGFLTEFTPFQQLSTHTYYEMGGKRYSNSSKIY